MSKFKPGESGNPAGRPKGSKNRLAECFIAGLCEDFEEHGIEVIEEVRTSRPHEYLRICASLIPKDFKLEVGNPLFAVSGQPLTSEEWQLKHGGDLDVLDDSTLERIAIGKQEP